MTACSVPSAEQREALLAQLDAMEPSQWLAIVCWMIDRIVADDQRLAIEILSREATRRHESANKCVSDETRKRSATDCLDDVFRDVGVSVSVPTRTLRFPRRYSARVQ